MESKKEIFTAMLLDAKDSTYLNDVIVSTSMGCAKDELTEEMYVIEQGPESFRSSRSDEKYLAHIEGNKDHYRELAIKNRENPLGKIYDELSVILDELGNPNIEPQFKDTFIDNALNLLAEEKRYLNDKYSHIPRM